MASEVKIVTVLPHQGIADYRTITDAIKACNDGDTIMVKIGQYDEKVVIDKSVHIVGDAETNSDVVVTGGVVCVTGGSLQNVTVQGLVDIRSGAVTIEKCDISQGFDGIRVQRDANPTIVRNSIHDAQQGGDGIYFGDSSKGIAEENDIYKNRMNGIHVNNAEAVIRANRIHDCPYGVFLRKGGRGVIERNVISSIRSFGIYITTLSDPIVSDNNVSSCDIHALMISQEGKGTIKENNITGSVTIKRLCSPTMGGNTIAGRMDNENSILAGNTLASVPH